MIDIILQIIIFITGVTAIFLCQSPNRQANKWACVIGLIGQPFWFYTSFINDQWGIFIMSFFFTFAWVRGIKTFWLNKRKIK